MIQSGLRHAEVAPATQAGDGDWIINFHPAGIDSRSRFMAYGSKEDAYSDMKEGFYLVASPP